MEAGLYTKFDDYVSLVLTCRRSLQSPFAEASHQSDEIFTTFSNSTVSYAIDPDAMYIKASDLFCEDLKILYTL